MYDYQYGDRVYVLSDRSDEYDGFGSVLNDEGDGQIAVRMDSTGKTYYGNVDELSRVGSRALYTEREKFKAVEVENVKAGDWYIGDGAHKVKTDAIVLPGEVQIELSIGFVITKPEGSIVHIWSDEAKEQHYTSIRLG